MTDPRKLLDEIEARTVTEGETIYTPGAGYLRAAGLPKRDLDALLAALRAVLDVIDGQHEYTCESSWVVGQIRQAITEALEGTADGS